LGTRRAPVWTTTGDLLAGGHGVGSVAITQSERTLGCCASRVRYRRFFAGDSPSAGIAVGAQINHSALLDDKVADAEIRATRRRRDRSES
jgi:hypothetical protein